MAATKNGVNGKAHSSRIADAFQEASQVLTISAPNFQAIKCRITGDAPYVQLMFGEKARNIMREKQAAGSTAGKGKKREAKDFGAAFLEAQHISKQGWNGIPAAALRRALVEACTVVGFHKTKAKKGIFVEADGFDRVEGTPLVKIVGEPRHVEHSVRNATGVADIRVRAMFDEGWWADVSIRFDADMFTPMDVTNLLARAGMQVGIGEGRPDSKNSTGMGWGTFVVQGK